MNDDLTLVGAYTTGCLDDRHAIKTYDDGFGDCYVYHDSFGPVGVVRAMTWEDAYKCVLDEILTPINDDDVIEAYGFGILVQKPGELNHFSPHWGLRDDVKKTAYHVYDDYPENGRGPTIIATFNSREEAKKYAWETIERDERDLVEGYHYQPNAGAGTGIVLEDLNGNSLDLLTPELRSELGITLAVEQC